MKFKATIWKTGGSYVVTIPRDFIDSQVVEHGKEYEVEVREVGGNDS